MECVLGVVSCEIVIGKNIYIDRWSCNVMVVIVNVT
jgi:hypothetical protein